MWLERGRKIAVDSGMSNAESQNLGLFGHSTLQHYHDGMPFKSYQKPKLSELEKMTLHNEERVEDNEFLYVTYSGEHQMKLIQELCAANLSEPYSVFTFRYFVNNWPYLTYLAMDKKNDMKCVGLIVAQLKTNMEGYIAMLVVDSSQRRKGLGTKLVHKSISKMIKLGADLVMLETEVDNFAALKLYQKMGFVKDYKYENYYLNGNGAFRLKLWLSQPKPVAKPQPVANYEVQGNKVIKTVKHKGRQMKMEFEPIYSKEMRI